MSADLGKYNLPRSTWEGLIDEWIFSEKQRAMMKRKLLDGITYEQLAEEFEMSTRGAFDTISKGMRMLIPHIAAKLP